MQLEHKLKHALDSVRQVEFMRSALIDATSMKEMLQRQVDELKAKNKEMETSKEASSDALFRKEAEECRAACSNGTPCSQCEGES